MFRDRTGSGLTLERRVQLLELNCALLAEEVWWHQLPCYRRWFYWLQGFRSPIHRFFGDVEDEIAAKQRAQLRDRYGE